MFLVVVKSPVNQAFLCHSDCPGFIQGIWLDNTVSSCFITTYSFVYI